MAEKITKDNKLNDVITKYPATWDVFLQHGMPKYVGRLTRRAQGTVLVGDVFRK